MMQFAEGTHYRRRETQPAPAPHRFKEAVDCLLCSDPGDDDNSQVGFVHMKRSRAIGQNIRLEISIPTAKKKTSANARSTGF